MNGVNNVASWRSELIVGTIPQTEQGNSTDTPKDVVVSTTLGWTGLRRPVPNGQKCGL